jgi:membrane peptidoglycan carboxypeptidase
VAYADIPELVRSAFVSSEDTGFFRHRGVEVGAIIGAAERNAEANRAAIGGSTITMQTVKNLFLARDKTLSRKLQEVFLAWHLERAISKERILEIYLNMVEFGPGLYGIGRASQKFFGKHPRELSLKESIYLASLLPAPIPRFRYFCKGELTPNYARIVRQLLDRMLTLGRITSAQHAAATSETLEFSRLERESESACARIASHTGKNSSEMGPADVDSIDSEAINSEKNRDQQREKPGRRSEFE